MQKQPFGVECKICNRPFTVFRWKPGGPKTRYKKTEVCQNCAKMKNVCQTCLFDLKFGLPVQVRDTLLGDDKVSIPKSDIMKEYAAQQSERIIESGQLPYGQQHGSIAVDPNVARHVKHEPSYHRNRAHICSFWLKGECKRGEACPFRHEKPEHDSQSALAKQSIKDRYYGVDDPLARAILDGVPEDKRLKRPPPPEDKAITTLWLGGVVDSSEAEIRLAMKDYGTLEEISYLPHRFCAFVKFADRAAAEAAVDGLYGQLRLADREIRIGWSRSHGVSKDADGEYDSLVQKQNKTRGGSGSGGVRPTMTMAMPARVPAPIVPLSIPGPSLAVPMAPPSTSSSTSASAKPIAFTGMVNPAAGSTSIAGGAVPSYPSMNPYRLGSVPVAASGGVKAKVKRGEGEGGAVESQKKKARV